MEPSVVEITVTPGPRGRRFPARRLVAVAAVGALVAILVSGVVFAVSALTRSGSGPRPIEPVSSREPLRCQTSAVSGAWPSQIDRGGSCWHYGVNLTTILRYVHGEWRLALAARSPACPDVPLPASVRAQLAVCRR
jgi:hypothetical protein